MKEFEKNLYGNLVAFMKNRPLTLIQRDKVKAVIAMLQREFLTESDKDYETIPGRGVHKSRIRLQLMSILGAFQKVPKDIAPNEDKGIYFEKAMEDLKELIQKYDGDGLRCPHCGAKVELDGEYYICQGCDFALDVKEYRPALYTLKGKPDHSELVLEGDFDE